MRRVKKFVVAAIVASAAVGVLGQSAASAWIVGVNNHGKVCWAIDDGEANVFRVVPADC